MMAKRKLQVPKKEIEVLVVVYSYQAKKKSELMKDLEERYLPSIAASEEKIIPKTFKQLCKGI